jgi:hypothetical protein
MKMTAVRFKLYSLKTEIYSVNYEVVRKDKGEKIIYIYEYI